MFFFHVKGVLVKEDDRAAVRALVLDQAVAVLIVVLVFLIIFFGPEKALGYNDDSMLIIVGSTIAGLIICLIGSFLIATEDTEGMVSLKDTSKILGGDKE